MNQFYVGAALLLVAAVVIIIFPWLRRNSAKQEDTLTNTGIIRQRIDELTSEQDQGLLSEKDRQLSENEFKMALLDEVKSKDSESSSGKLAVLVALVISLAVGLTVYYHANEVDKIVHWQQTKQSTSELGQRILQGDENLTLEDMQDFSLGLRSRLIEEPDDPIGWMLLGRVSAAINRVDNAIKAFEKSVELDPNNTGTLSSYAQALLMTGQEQQILQAKRVLLHVLSVEADNTNAMGMLAVAASELGDKQLALDNWQKLRQFVPKEDPNYLAIGQRIEQLTIELQGGQADSKGAEAPLTENSAKDVENSGNKRVAVTVTLASELEGQLPKAGYLFVFAQDPTGQVRMPAAVVKMPLPGLPVVVELSNQNAMMANYTLSQLKQAKLVARISADENVMPASGELEGELEVSLSDSELTKENIVINKVLK
ncbi:c-type cytochrome biogenesis protein CcmI [Paraglaciecola aquimarina]|uniref:C-type cytochrome biogenesis protein CcmI n=1 Tax=Paraglaciecola aquimarina TaxID=1235557 RepID=A0ABU3T1I7_9ALTE|nr:c-type cytochrome biogenesis protein CcmI [Paraglaciecola aquimarina]MDU0356131.1 c-type cytochrome biogenesis protein CcmI [Paraglaciecola aquimarina]